MPNKHIITLIVLSQFFCTSVWFATNAIISDLALVHNLGQSNLGYLTSAIQFGFILGTFVYAIFTVSDRYSPSKVFFSSAIMAGLLNLSIIWSGHSIMSLILIRMSIGFFLAGIYPVGMKIAADHYGSQLGRALGPLVGALVLGTALPHLLKWFSSDLSWQLVILITSALALLGGLIIYIFVPDGPYRKTSTNFNFTAIFSVFRDKAFSSAALGYFGHMWELYAFWAFVPIILANYLARHQITDTSIPLVSFCIIGVGSIGCLITGALSQHKSPSHLAYTSLFISGMCCILFPIIYGIPSTSIFIGFMMIWGLTVVSDSPMFSTLVAQNAPDNIQGTALTIVNCIGFAITIASIQLLSVLIDWSGSPYLYSILVLGPIVGIYSRIKRV